MWIKGVECAPPSLQLLSSIPPCHLFLSGGLFWTWFWLMMMMMMAKSFLSLPLPLSCYSSSSLLVPPFPCQHLHQRLLKPTPTRRRSSAPNNYFHRQYTSLPSPMVVARYPCSPSPSPPPLFSVAPMMDWTDIHFRTLARLVSQHAWLYTEMLASDTIVHQQHNLDRFLYFPPDQHPIVLQIGGNNLDSLAKATQLANSYGYDEINLNCGCPSPRVVGHGSFGVRLMLDPKFVGEAMTVIAANTEVPVTVKCRIGVDDHDSYNELCDFIYKVSSTSPTKHFIIHSRKALLNGISPAENRTIPPLKYEYYFALVRDFPDLKFTINGGINSVEEANMALKAGAHGVMVGRAAYNNPWQLLRHVDTAIYGAPPSELTRREVLKKYQEYGDNILGKHGNNRPNVRDVVKPLMNFFHSEPGNSLWKRTADAAFRHCTTVKQLFDETLVAIPDHVLDSPVAKAPPNRGDIFAGVHDILPHPYKYKDKSNDLELLYA